MTGDQIFGREPAFWVGLIEGVLAFLLSWHVFNLTSDQVGAIMAVVTLLFGLYTAYVTKHTMLGIGVGLVKAVVALFAAYKFTMTPDHTAAVIALATLLLGSFQRTQTSPALKGSFRLAA